MTLQDTLTYQPVELAFGTSGLRALVTDMTDLECYINGIGFLRFLESADGLEPGNIVYLAGDLRQSTPRILAAMQKAISDAGYRTVYCGLIPTPALAYIALQKHSPCIMVTGSHIPEDRNGIKFYKRAGEVLKEDELGIKEAVATFREAVYSSDAKVSDFGSSGDLLQPPALPTEDGEALAMYLKHYTDVFNAKTLAGVKVVFYQHSSVGRDSLSGLLQDLGAEVILTGRSDKFVPIDSENVTPDDQAYFKVLARQHPDAFAIVSTDGDSDRPFVVDEQGVFHRGDVLGAINADWMKADFAAYPVSSSDAVDHHLSDRKVAWQHTRIGSPYVISVMQEAVLAGHERVVGWEVNGGLLLGSDIEMRHHKILKALPTRDAILPIIGALVMAHSNKQSMSQLFGSLEQRFTQAGLIDNFSGDVYKLIAARFAADTSDVRRDLGQYFSSARGFGEITQINSLDGVRIYFDNGDIAHLRQSNNAPQLRMYSVANTQERADAIVSLAIAEEGGIFRELQGAVSA